MSFRDDLEAARARADAAEREAERLRQEMEELRSGRADAWDAAAHPLAFVGIGGNVLAVERASGTVRWQTKLASSGTVLVVWEHGVLLASGRGETFRLDPESGREIWRNRLERLGYGLPSLHLSPPGRAPAELLFVGLAGTVLALDLSTGIERWRRKLKGRGFVSLTLVGRDLFATAVGEIYCLEPADGSVRWSDPLRGLGLGLVSVAASGVAGLALELEHEKREAARRQAAAT